MCDLPSPCLNYPLSATGTGRFRHFGNRSDLSLLLLWPASQQERYLENFWDWFCSEPFTRMAHRLDGPGPITRQKIEYMGQARLLDELSSKRDRPRVYGPAHLLDSLSSK